MANDDDLPRAGFQRNHLGRFTRDRPKPGGAKGALGHYGALDPMKRALIHPFKVLLFTCTHSPLFSRTSNRVPFGADPTTELVSDGFDLTFTPGRCENAYGWL